LRRRAREAEKAKKAMKRVGFMVADLNRSRVGALGGNRHISAKVRNGQIAVTWLN